MRSFRTGTALIAALAVMPVVWAAPAAGDERPAPPDPHLVLRDDFSDLQADPPATLANVPGRDDPLAGLIRREYASVATPSGRGIHLKHNAAILYQAPPLNTAHGTIELRVATAFDISERKGPNVELWRLEGEQSGRRYMARLYIIPAHNELLVQVYNAAEGQTLQILRTPVRWKAGEWHRVKLTWRHKTGLYVDGELRALGPSDGLLTAAFPSFQFETDEARLIVGSRLERLRSDLVVDALRVYDAQMRFEAGNGDEAREEK